jgi:hypothetical protein
VVDKRKLSLYKLANYMNKGDQKAAKEIAIKYPYVLGMHYKAGDIEKNPFCIAIDKDMQNLALEFAKVEPKSLERGSCDGQSTLNYILSHTNNVDLVMNLIELDTGNISSCLLTSLIAKNKNSSVIKLAKLKPSVLQVDCREKEVHDTPINYAMKQNAHDLVLELAKLDSNTITSNLIMNLIKNKVNIIVLELVKLNPTVLEREVDGSPGTTPIEYVINQEDTELTDTMIEILDSSI